MSLPLDDVQITRHAMGQLAEQTAILRQQLGIQGFHGHIQDEMVLIWWRSLIASALAPNLGELMQSLLDEQEEEE